MAMPGMSGKEVLPGLQEINAEVKVVLSSGFRGDKRVSEAIEAGTCGFIQKPYTMKELLSSVAEVLSL
jgi:DNA-binding NtrC family response regulator